jgi:hypothetical protein
MRTVLILAVACSFLAGSVHHAGAQERGLGGPGPFATQESFAREQKHALALVDVYLSAGYKTIEKEAAAALEKIGSPAVFPLEQKLEEMWKDYLLRKDPKDLKNVTKIAKLLGKFGVPLAGMGSFPEPDNPQKVVRNKVRQKLIEIAKAPYVEKEEIEARQAAIEALGKIHSQKAAYLIMNHPEILRSFQKTKDLAKELRKKAQDLKARFVRTGQMVGLPDQGAIAEILLDARNLQRYFDSRSNRKLLIFFSEMEPRGKEQSLKERADMALAELENNLRIAASGYDAQAKGPKASQICKEWIEAVKRDAWLKANRNAFDLCEDMEYLVADTISEKWQDELDQVHEVLDAFQSILLDIERRRERRIATQVDAEPESEWAIRFSVLQATRRMYAGDE